jgi:hypothetical protein
MSYFQPVFGMSMSDLKLWPHKHYRASWILVFWFIIDGSSIEDNGYTVVDKTRCQNSENPNPKDKTMTTLTLNKKQ